jgi:hypothetical protein
MSTSAIGRFKRRHGVDAARARLASVIQDCEGVLIVVAHREGIHRSHIYRLVKEWRLWPVVNRARVERAKRLRWSRAAAA